MPNQRLPRPLKKSEFEIFLETKSAAKGWKDFVATRRNEAVSTWDFLTTTPFEVNLHNYKLKSNLATISRNGERFDRWQYKPSLTGDIRIWFYIVGKKVFIENVFTHHPNKTK